MGWCYPLQGGRGGGGGVGWGGGLSRGKVGVREDDEAE